MPNSFYNPSQVQGADYTGYSKGFKSNSLVGGVFEGAGQTLDYAVKATDQYYQGTIKEEARTATESLYDDYGNSSAVATEAGLNDQVTPKEIQEGVNRLNLLKQATANGTLKESSFWAQAELISRQLKMRYPGYWEHVDGTMSQLLGRKPAQALHAELDAERKATANKSDVERRQALAAARSVGLTEVFIAESKGKPYSTVEINSLVANRNNIKWSQENASRTFALKKARNEATEADAELAARTEVHAEFTTLLHDSASPLFKDSKSYGKFAQEIRAQTAAGKGVDPQLQAQATAAKAKLKETVSNLRAKYLLKYGSDMDPKKLEDIVGFMEDWMDRFTFQIEDGDLAVGKTNAAILKSTQNYDVLKFMNSNDVFRKDGALIRFYGEQPYTQWAARNLGKGIIEDKDIAIEKFMSDDYQLGEKSLTETIQTMMKEGVTDPQSYKEHLTKAKDVITAEESPTIVKENAIEGMYGKKNKDFLYKSVRPEERHEMFMQLSSPSETKKIQKVFEEGKISAASYQKRLDWVRNNAVNLIRDNAPDINSIAEFRQSADIKYNPKTNQIDVKDLPYSGTVETAFGRGLEQFYDKVKRDNAKSSVRKVNDILRNVKVILEATGQDPNEELPLLLEKSGINIVQPTTKEESGLTPAIRAVENYSVSEDASGVSKIVEETVNSLLGEDFDKKIIEGIKKYIQDIQEGKVVE